MRLEDLRHQKVHQRPELHQRVLERRAGEKEPALRVEVEQRLPPLGSEVLDILGLVQDEVLPLFAAESDLVLNNNLVGSDAHVERVGF